MCAINRGESRKILSIKLSLSTAERERFVRYLREAWIRPRRHVGVFFELMTSSVDDAFKRLVEPRICRHAWYEYVIDARALRVRH